MKTFLINGYYPKLHWIAVFNGTLLVRCAASSSSGLCCQMGDPADENLCLKAQLMQMGAGFLFEAWQWAKSQIMGGDNEV